MNNLSSIFKDKVPEVGKMNEEEVVDQVDKNLDINFKIYGRTFSNEPKSVFDIESRTKATNIMTGNSSNHNPLDRTSGDYVRNIIGSGSGKDMNVTEYISGSSRQENTSFDVHRIIGTSGNNYGADFNTSNKINVMLGTFGPSKKTKQNNMMLKNNSQEAIYKMLGNSNVKFDKKSKNQKINQSSAKLNSMLGLSNKTQPAIYKMLGKGSNQTFKMPGLGVNNSQAAINKMLGKTNPILDNKSKNRIVDNSQIKLNSMLGLNNGQTQVSINKIIGNNVAQKSVNQILGINNTQNSINKMLGHTNLHRDMYGRNLEDNTAPKGLSDERKAYLAKKYGFDLDAANAEQARVDKQRQEEAIRNAESSKVEQEKTVDKNPELPNVEQQKADELRRELIRKLFGGNVKPIGTITVDEETNKVYGSSINETPQEKSNNQEKITPEEVKKKKISEYAKRLLNIKSEDPLAEVIKQSIKEKYDNAGLRAEIFVGEGRKAVGSFFDKTQGLLTGSDLDSEIERFKKFYTIKELDNLRFAATGSLNEAKYNMSEKRDFLNLLKRNAGSKDFNANANNNLLTPELITALTKGKGKMTPEMLKLLINRGNLSDVPGLTKPKETGLQQALKGMREGFGAVTPDAENLRMSAGLRNDPNNIVQAVRTSDTPWEQRVRGSVGTVGTGRNLGMYDLEPASGSNIYQYISPIGSANNIDKYLNSGRKTNEELAEEQIKEHAMRQKQLDDLDYLRQLKEAKQGLRQENQYNKYQYSQPESPMPQQNYVNESPSGLGSIPIVSPASGRLVKYVRGTYTKHN